MRLAWHKISRAKWNIGLTLIELLAVIAMIAVLASLLLPALSRGKALASATKCKRNLGQMGVALAMYLSDNEGAYPAQVANTPPWQPSLTGYLGANDDYWLGAVNTVFQCPTHLLLQVPVAPQMYVNHPSYGYNAVGNPKNRKASNGHSGLGGVIRDLTTWERPTREPEVRNPAEMIAIGDGYMAPALHGAEPDRAEMEENFILGRDVDRLLFMLGWSHDRKSVEQRHRGLLNMVLCDGHVEEGRINAWYFSEDERSARRWNIDNVK